MIIYLALIIPVLTILYLLLYQKKQIVWWEAVLVFIIPLLFIMLTKFIGQRSLMYTTEYWNSFASSADYYEPWDERVSCRHPIYRTRTHRDSKGHTYTTRELVGYRHLYDVDYHPAYWTINGSGSEKYNISEFQFNELSNRWKNKTFIDLNRNYHSIDGNKYTTRWDNNLNTIESITTEHKYKNKIKNSDTVFQFKKINKKELKYILDYNQIDGYKCKYIYNWSNESDQILLQRINAFLGAKKKVVIMILVYENKPIEYCYNQEAYWKGGNQNEFIICISKDKDNNIQWAHVISWTPKTTLKVEVGREITEMKIFNMYNILTYIGAKIDKEPGIIRRDFEEFDYITVPVPLWSIILAYILSIILSIGLAYGFCTNDIKEK